MIRPEARATLERWQGVLLSLLVVGLGLYWAFFTGGGLLHWIGYGVVAAGLALLAAAVQRARFLQGRDGPGIVSIVERRIHYHGPLYGGVLDVIDLQSIVLDPRSTPHHWILAGQPQDPPLLIPVNAEGVSGLFDIFSTLPGMKIETMLSQMNGVGAHPVVIWRSQDVQERVSRLH